MNIYETETRTSILVEKLVKVWEESVRSTHLFLSEQEIGQIKEYVPQALKGVKHLIIAEEVQGEPIAFMGVDSSRLEMLFLSPDQQGKGIGGQLLKLAIEKYGVGEVTVNEQNPQAVGFYEHMGFETYKHTDYDEEGNPYPLLYMNLK